MRLKYAAALAPLFIAPAWAEQAAQPEETFAVAERAAIQAETHMVAAANPIAVEVGRDVLAAGGSAADAAVAVQFMLNLVEPQSSGIGGGAFLLYWDASEGKLTTFDGRERAPLAADETYFLKADGEPMGWFEAVPGGKSVGVPGTLMLLETVHERFGVKPWAELIEPTIALADAGFEISPRLADSIAAAQSRALDSFEPTRTYFFEDGAPKAAGTLLQNPDFAKSLRLIADHGSEPFYEGAIAAGIIDTIRNAPTNPGIMTLADLAAYEVVERAPVCMDYRGYEVCGMGPPTSGGLTIGQILGILSHFDMGEGPSAEAWHLFIEASKLAYADRGLYMADSDYVDMPEGLLDPAYLAERAALIDPEAAMEKAEPGTPPWEETRRRAPDSQEERPGTSHFVIVDAEGDMVSITTTIETGFGSRLMSGGFLLNNELTDFSRAPVGDDGAPIANRVAGGKRPRSSMSPTIVLKDGQPVLLIGSPGGSRIIAYVAKALVSILDWNMDPQVALDMGHVVNRNGATDLEEETDATALEEALTAMGHQVNVRNLNSGLHAIQITAEGLLGAADPRREGTAMGE